MRLLALAARKRPIIPLSLSLKRGPEDCRICNEVAVCRAAADIDDIVSDENDTEDDFCTFLLDLIFLVPPLPSVKPTPTLTDGPLLPRETPTFVSKGDNASISSS